MYYRLFLANQHLEICFVVFNKKSYCGLNFNESEFNIMERMLNQSIFRWTAGVQEIYPWLLRVILSVFASLLSGIRAYEQLGYRAFGTPGKMAAGIAITLQNIGGETLPNTQSQETQCIVLWPCEGRYTNTHSSAEDLKTDLCHSFLIDTLGSCSYLFLFLCLLVQLLPPHPSFIRLENVGEILCIHLNNIYQ